MRSINFWSALNNVIESPDGTLSVHFLIFIKFSLFTHCHYHFSFTQLQCSYSLFISFNVLIVHVYIHILRVCLWVRVHRIICMLQDGGDIVHRCATGVRPAASFWAVGQAVRPAPRHFLTSPQPLPTGYGFIPGHRMPQGFRCGHWSIGGMTSLCIMALSP